MEANITHFKRCALVKIDGRIDSSNADAFHDVFKELNEGGTFKLVFDMKDIDFLSSRGWWVLVQTQKTCKRYNRGELVLSRIKKPIQDSLDLVGLQTYFKIFGDTTSAVGNF